MKQDREATRPGRLLSLILRHRPEAAGIRLDRNGWADVEQLVAGMAGHMPFDRAKLEEIVRTDAKRRYVFSPDGARIRACQGHSVPVDVEPVQARPPEILWHGTAEPFTASIERQGLLPQGRLYVHLSADVPTALSVGRRHGRPVVYRVDSGRMAREGAAFWLAENGVWMIRAVPPRYLQRQPETER